MILSNGFDIPVKTFSFISEYNPANPVFICIFFHLFKVSSAEKPWSVSMAELLNEGVQISKMYYRGDKYLQPK